MSAAFRGLFVTGTDTGVGKTHVAAMIVRELRSAGIRVGAFKPACSGSEQDQSGADVWDDIRRLQAALGMVASQDDICPQRFRAPLAPPVAARAESRIVDLQAIDAALTRWGNRADAVVIEGVGGWLCPLTEDATFADWAAGWGFPVLIVSRLGLGTINHSLLTIESVRSRGLTAAGVVLNAATPGLDLSTDTNPGEIESRSGVPVLGCVNYGRPAELLRGGEPVRMEWQTLMEPARRERHG